MNLSEYLNVNVKVHVSVNLSEHEPGTSKRLQSETGPAWFNLKQGLPGSI